MRKEKGKKRQYPDDDIIGIVETNLKIPIKVTNNN
jgi:hypothetical protein